MKKDSLGDRMKAFYEARCQTELPRRMPAIIRLDGVAFHTLTKGMKKPWDTGMSTCMEAAAADLVARIQGCKLAYVQSDEISLLLTDYDNLNTEAWFGRNVQKMVSVSAAIATNMFNVCLEAFYDKGPAFFDARTFVLPKEEVCNYFIWRQNDAVRNSISGLAQSKFSHKELHGVNCDQMQEMLWQKHGINWANTPTRYKRGFCIRRTDRGVVTDVEIPTFSIDRRYIEHLLVPQEELIEV